VGTVHPLLRLWIDLAVVAGLVLLLTVFAWASDGRPGVIQSVTCAPPNCPGLVPAHVGLPDR
jgi:hypothetical protein